MTSPSLADSGERLLASLTGNIKKPPRTVADIFGEIVQLADQADKLALEIANLKADPQTAGLLHRAAVLCRDLHSGLSVAMAGLSPELKNRLGIKVTT
jgi:hypothetical protein